MEVTDNPRYPYKPPIPLTVAINPVIEPLDDETGRDQRGLPVGAAAGQRAAARQHPGAVPRPRRRRARRDQAWPHRRHVAARVRPPRRRAVHRPGRRSVDAHDLGGVRRSSIAPRSSSGSPCSSSESDRDDRSGANSALVDGAAVESRRHDRDRATAGSRHRSGWARRAPADADRLSGCHDPGPRERTQPRVPSCAAVADPARSAARSGRGAT